MKITIVLDGYSAPLTAGNFVEEVLQGTLEGRRLDASYTSVLAEADADGNNGVQPCTCVMALTSTSTDAGGTDAEHINHNESQGHSLQASLGVHASCGQL